MRLIIMKGGRGGVTLMSVCIHCHLKLYARVMAVKLEELTRNCYDRPVLSFSSNVLLCEGRFDMSLKNVVHFLQTPAISSQGDIIRESSSWYCLALMSNWNISACLPQNVILYCAL